MRAFVDQHTIMVSEGAKTIMVAAQDPAFGPLRDYLTDQDQEQDFDTARSIVFMSRHLVEAFGRSGLPTSVTTTVTWNRD